MDRRTTEQYRFIVEGDTEKWYLEHLQSLINSSDSQSKVKFSITVDSTRYESIIKSCPATVQTDYFVFVMLRAKLMMISGHSRPR